MKTYKMIIIGAGGRGVDYSVHLVNMRDQFEIVGVADPIKERRDNLKNMFGFGVLPAVSKETVYYLKSYTPCLLMAVVGSTPLVKKLVSRWKNSMLETVVLAVLFLLVTAFLVNGSFNPFLYFRF